MVFGLERANLGWTIAIGAFALLLAVGLPLINAAISTPHQVKPGSVGNVGLGVSITPADGWSSLAESKPGVREFTLGGLRLVITADTFSGTQQNAYDVAAKTIGDQDGYKLTGTEQTFQTTSQLVGIGRSYATSTAAGYFVVFVVNGVFAWASVEGPVDAWNASINDISAMLQSITMAAPQS